MSKIKNNDNIEEIKRIMILSEIISRDIDLRKDGNEFKGCCPFHDEDTASFFVNDAKGFYYCFGCGASGDVIDYVMESRGMSFKQALSQLTGDKELKPARKTKTLTKAEQKDNLTVILPAPAGATNIIAGEDYYLFNAKRNYYTKFNPASVYQYRNANNEILGYICRINLHSESDKSRKIFYTVIFCKKEDGSREWCIKAFPAPRPIFRLETIQNNDNQVMICEGEKAAEAAFQIFGGGNIISWPGGADAVRFVDWLPLQGRKVVIWPDADEPGLKAAEAIKDELLKIGAKEIKIVYPPLDQLEKGFDAADALAQNWSKEMVASFLKKHCREAKRDELKIASQMQDLFDLQDEFLILGHNQGNYYYLPKRGKQIIELTAAAHGKLNLFQLAPLGWWESKFAHLGNDGKINFDMICSALIDKATRRGIFDDTEMCRGRGAWIEDGKKIMHLGNAVYIDNERFEPGKTPTKRIYEAAATLDFDKDIAPLSDERSKAFFDICKKFSWENSLSAKLLAGWCVLAPVCGALSWRPHIFITGASGAGKSTINNMIIKPMLGNFPLFVEGKTTEAGIRHTLNRDALPVVFDEAEAEDKESLQRMQGVLNLARLASSGSVIIKATPTGGSISYCIRSMFCFFAINPAISEYAEASRITKLVLKKNFAIDNKDKYNNLVKLIHSTIDRDYASSMIKRTFNNIESLLHNIKIFEIAGLEIFSEKRQADQLAPMLAGAYLCVSRNNLDLEQAKEWLRGEDWVEHAAIHILRDEERLINKILTTNIKFDDGQLMREISVGELILRAIDSSKRGVDSLARSAIRRIGIDVFDGKVWFANNSDPLQKLLENTPWSKSWGQQLKNIKTAEPAHVRSYSPGINSRGTTIPFSFFEVEND